MKISRKKHVLILLLIGVIYFVGVAAIIYPIIGDAYMTNSSKTTIQNYVKTVENMSDDEIEKKLAEAQKYNENVAKGTYLEGDDTALNNADGLIGYVDIPAQDIYLPVYYGTSDEVLEKGCGWIEKTSLPVGGKSTHASISGHTGLPNAEMFTKLDQAKLGDVFYIHVLDRLLVYQVDNINTVSPNDTKHLLVEPDEDYVTLVTCTPYGINDKRLLVRGKRIFPEEEPSGQSQSSLSSADIDGAETTAQAAMRVDDRLQKVIDHDMRVILIIVAIAVVVFAAACIWLGRILKHRAKYARKKPSEEAHEKTEE